MCSTSSQIRFDVGRRGLNSSEPDGHVRSGLDEKLTLGSDHTLDVVTLDGLDDFIHDVILHFQSFVYTDCERMSRTVHNAN